MNLFGKRKHIDELNERLSEAVRKMKRLQDGFSEISEEFDDAGAEDGLVDVLADTADDLDEIIVLLEEKMEN